MNLEKSQQMPERRRREVAKERVREVLKDKINEAPDPKAFEILPKIAVEADGDSIENQRIDIIDEGDAIMFTFKLVENKWIKLTDKLRDDPSAKYAKINYFNYKNSHKYSYDLSVGYKINVGKFEIYVARGPGENNVRSSYGLVQIRIDKTDPESKTAVDNSAQITEELEGVMRDHLDIQDALLSPDEKGEKDLKLARYKWAHILPETHQMPDKEEGELLDKLKRREVLPGYSTIVQEGRAEKIKKIGPFFLYHSCHSYDSLPNIISNGLMSTHERFRRGLMIHGTSSTQDLQTGGEMEFFLGFGQINRRI